jgi:serine/threonine protein kinase
MIDFGLSKDFGEGTGNMKTMSGSVSVRILSDDNRLNPDNIFYSFGVSLTNLLV